MIPAQVEMVATITGLLAALGVGSILTKLVEGLIASATGKHDREAARVRAIMDARDKAEDERDTADARRRIVTEHAHRLRLQVIELGGSPEPFPRYPTSDSD